MSRFQPLMRPGVDPFSATHKPPLPPAEYGRHVEKGLVIERNCVIPLRDGVEIFCDLYRPEGAERDLPILLAWGPYGKHGLSNNVFWPRSGVNPEWLSELTPFEGPDPVWWGTQGYAVAIVDPRGAWLSGGDFHHNGIQEAEDCADAIEWLGRLPWGNGRVGMTGVSYLAAIQYLVAPLKPGPLAALNPWEGFSDWYREFAYHGGILDTGFLPRASDNIRFSLNRTENTWENIKAHPLIDEYWESKLLDLEGITQPAYFVASWSDQGLHLRGTIEAWRRCSSEQKWLDIHGQKKWANYYLPASRERQLAFFDHFMRDRPTAVTAWPKVRMEVRERHGVAEERAEQEWPLARTEYRRLWLDGAQGALREEVPATGEVSYDATEGQALFDWRFDRETEISGNANLTLWVEADGSDDMDLFVALQKLDTDGQPVGFTFYAFFENGPIALGWLRASHRALDPELSSPERPVHPHTHEERLKPGECVPVEIELWPFSVRFAPGESLRVVVAGSDIYKREEGLMLPFALHEDTRNAGRHIIRTGEDVPSSILLPFIPGKTA
ncbi:CocE/NonD family hydrolase [Altererythrobacter sp. CC-YST694]|uniref:CocE/NonD family hydrolase n=1 Tax=Altererythrobacter sp. CC-YST694 TaxID=2755038 RepID=UPI001D00BCA0|nr:CocE/NonD family hydrolase [Altererythrobacter sp. CC-YST694]MCB5426424.1 CocE/NonD family hydrolase [Altererythrobacter sp. CC-YST694]